MGDVLTGGDRASEAMSHAEGLPPAVPPAAPLAPLPERILQSTPEQAVAFAAKTAKIILAEAKKHQWIMTIKGGLHYRIEAWQAIGAPYGITARVTRIELLTRTDSEEIYGVQAWAEAVHNPTGKIWGGAVQVCMADEEIRKRSGEVIRRWEGAGVHALVGMASTRACSRALAQVLRWVVGLSGVSGTPAEEMSP